jgi:HEPN domain-containing protein
LLKEIVCRWMKKALRDLKWAERMLADGDTDYSAFHSQQSVEKALKALLIARGRRPPRTHNVGQLLNELEKVGVETSEIQEARILTDYAVEARYQDFEEEVQEAEALEALNLARRVVNWAQRKLEKWGFKC